MGDLWIIGKFHFDKSNLFDLDKSSEEKIDFGVHTIAESKRIIRFSIEYPTLSIQKTRNQNAMYPTSMDNSRESPEWMISK
jgi:hypothetical protein